MYNTIIMKIISFDIGVNNLSYCILSYDNNDFDIIEWDILNVIPYLEENKNR